MDPQTTPTMAERGETLYDGPEEKPPGVTLNDSLVITGSRPKGLLPTCTIRLDRHNISSIGKLRSLGEIHSLYLQQNQIEKIENLDSFPNLRFLCLAGNRIQRVENLQPLPHLSALDLSHNQIRVLDTEELPRGLRILDLTGNECSRQEGYRDSVLAALPHLLLLDSQPIHGNTAEEKAGGNSSSSEEEDEELFPELRIPFTADKDFFTDLHRELAGRRRGESLEELGEHRDRLEELRERRDFLLDPGQDGATGTGTARQCQPCPQVKPRAALPASTGSQRHPGAIQPPTKALEKEIRVKGAGNRQLSQKSLGSTEPGCWE